MYSSAHWKTNIFISLLFWKTYHFVIMSSTIYFSLNALILSSYWYSYSWNPSCYMSGSRLSFLQLALIMSYWCSCSWNPNSRMRGSRFYFLPRCLSLNMWRTLLLPVADSAGKPHNRWDNGQPFPRMEVNTRNPIHPYGQWLIQVITLFKDGCSI